MTGGQTRIRLYYEGLWGGHILNSKAHPPKLTYHCLHYSLAIARYLTIYLESFKVPSSHPKRTTNKYRVLPIEAMDMHGTKVTVHFPFLFKSMMIGHH